MVSRWGVVALAGPRRRRARGRLGAQKSCAGRALSRLPLPLWLARRRGQCPRHALPVRPRKSPRHRRRHPHPPHRRRRLPPDHLRQPLPLRPLHRLQSRLRGRHPHPSPDPHGQLVRPLQDRRLPQARPDLAHPRQTLRHTRLQDPRRHRPHRHRHPPPRRLRPPSANASPVSAPPSPPPSPSASPPKRPTSSRP